jgi:hypothetical protein
MSFLSQELKGKPSGKHVIAIEGKRTLIGGDQGSTIFR